MEATQDFSFPRLWDAEILAERPPILPQRHFTYPREIEEAERGALEVLVRPHGGMPFEATFALGFADSSVPSGVWSCPAADQLCVVSGGYAYLVNASHPEQFVQVALRPVLQVRAVLPMNLLLFGGHYGLIAWGEDGCAWETPRLSSEGIRITEIDGEFLSGFGWDLMTDREVPFTVDLKTGRPIGEPRFIPDGRS